jgi:hypothetical protein
MLGVDFFLLPLEYRRMNKIKSNSQRIGLEQPTRPKRFVALAFRNGPIENVHAGKACPTCHGVPSILVSPRLKCEKS